MFMAIDAEIRLVIERYRQQYKRTPGGLLMSVEKYSSLCQLIVERGAYSMQPPSAPSEIDGLSITIAPTEIGSCLACLHPGTTHEQAATSSYGRSLSK